MEAGTDWPWWWSVSVRYVVTGDTIPAACILNAYVLDTSPRHFYRSWVGCRTSLEGLEVMVLGRKNSEGCSGILSIPVHCGHFYHHHLIVPARHNTVARNRHVGMARRPVISPINEIEIILPISNVI